MEEIIIKYRADIEGYKAELKDLEKADKQARGIVEKPMHLEVDTKDAEKQLNNIGKSTGFLDNIKQKAKEGFSGLKESIGGIINPMTAMAAAGTAIVGTFFKMIDVNRQFQQSLAELQSITGVTTKDLEFYRDQAKEIAQDKTLSSSLTETVNAFKLVGSAKPDLLQNKEALAEVTRQAILLSKASGDTLESSVNSLTGTLNQFNLGAEASARVIDILAAGSKAGAVAIPDLSAGLEKFGAVAKANNVTVEQAVALQETLGDKQIKGAEAGTQLRNIILKLANSGRGFVNGQFDINAALEQTRNEFNNIQDPVKRSQELTKLFGLESVTAGQILLDSTEQFKKYTTAVSEQGVALSQAQTNTNTFQGALTRLSNSFEALLAGGGGILNIFTPIVDVLAGALDYIGKFFAYVGTAISTFFAESQYIKKVGELFDTLWTSVKEIGLAIGEVFNSLGLGFLSAEKSGSIFAKAFDLIMTSIRAGIEGVILFIRNFKDIFIGAFEIIALNVKTFVNFWKNIFAGDFRGAFDVITGYFTGLSNIVGKTFDKIKLNVINAILGIAETVKPILSALGVDMDKLVKGLQATQKELSKKYEAKVKVTTTTDKKDLSTKSTTSTATAIADEVQGKASKGGKKVDPKKEAERIEKEKNDAILKERDAALKKISDLEVRKQKELIAELEATGASKNRIEEEKIKLLEAEQKYNNQILAVRSSFAKELASKYTDTKQKELDAIVEGNKKIAEEEAKIRNERTKLEISQTLTAPDNNTARLERLKKNLQDETTLTVEEANKKKIALLKIEEEILLSKMLFNDKQINDLLAAGADYEGEMVQSRLKANEELNQKLIDANKARLNEERKQEEDAIKQKRELLKKQLDSIFEFANNGLLLQIGIDPQALAKVKSDIESAYKVFNDPNATDQQKLLAGAQAAQSAVVMGIDAIRNAERQAAEEKLAEIAVQEEAELKSAEGNEAKQAIIRQKYEAKRKEVKRKEAEADKRAAITKAIINTAVEIAKVAATPFLIPIVAAIGAAQVALIASQPIPKFEKGGLVGKPISDGLLSGKPHSAGGVLLEAEGGEFIINRKATKNHLPLLEAINDGSISDILNKHYILPSIQEKEAEVMQKSEKRINDIQNVLIQKTIVETLKSMEKKADINTSKIVQAVKKDGFKL